MSGKEHGSPKESGIPQPHSPQNRSTAIRYQPFSEQELEEQRTGEDHLDPRHSGSDATNSVPSAGTEEASTQPPRLRTNEDPRSADPGTTRDVALGQAGQLRTTDAETSRRSLARPPLSIDTRPVTAESNLVCNLKTYNFPSCMLNINEGDCIIYMINLSRMQ